MPLDEPVQLAQGVAGLGKEFALGGAVIAIAAVRGLRQL